MTCHMTFERLLRTTFNVSITFFSGIPIIPKSENEHFTKTLEANISEIEKHFRSFFHQYFQNQCLLLRRCANLRKVEPRMNFPFRKYYMNSSSHTAHKINLPLIISSVNVTKSAGNRRNYLMKNFIFCAVSVVLSNDNGIILKCMNVI